LRFLGSEGWQPVWSASGSDAIEERDAVNRRAQSQETRRPEAGESRATAPEARPVAPGAPRSLSVGDVQQLQRFVGNRAIAAMLTASSRPTISRVPIKGFWKNGLEGDDLQTYLRLVGAAKNTDELSVENLEGLIELFANNTIISNELKKAKRINAGEEQVVVEPEPETEEHRAGRERDLLAKGLEQFGGLKTWKELEPKIIEWFLKVKSAEATDTFEDAYKANRMTARQIDLGGRGGRFSVKKPDTSPGRIMTLSRGIQGIEQRVKPENFFDLQTGRSKKNERGLHDLSASILDHRRGSISSQLKFYDNAIVLFMPAPEQDDLRVFAALARLEDRDVNMLRFIRSQMTRIKLAQGSDMGTSFSDVSEEGGPDKFSYGSTGTIIRMKGGLAKPATETELKARGTNALEYKSVLDAGVTTVNEIVMSYRSHASKDFPMYARWDATNKRFHILDANLAALGRYIADAGVMEVGTPPPETEKGLEEPQKDLEMERFMWALQIFVREHAKDPQTLRDVLLLLTRAQRMELKRCYEAGVYLGDDNRLDRAVEARVIEIIENIEVELMRGHQRPVVMDGGPRDVF
jgi:hypothetical protein